MPMKRICGFISFWIAIGLVVALFIDSLVIHVLIILVLLLLGYNLFCC